LIFESVIDERSGPHAEINNRPVAATANCALLVMSRTKKETLGSLEKSRQFERNGAVAN
jgi:hypothetical protein